MSFEFDSNGSCVPEVIVHCLPKKSEIPNQFITLNAQIYNVMFWCQDKNN